MAEYPTWEFDFDMYGTLIMLSEDDLYNFPNPDKLVEWANDHGLQIVDIDQLTQAPTVLENVLFHNPQDEIMAVWLLDKSLAVLFKLTFG